MEEPDNLMTPAEGGATSIAVSDGRCLQMAPCQHRKETAESLILYIGFFSLGMALVLPGPTLLDLAGLTGSDTRSVSSIFMVRSVCGLAGSVGAGLLVSRVNPWLPFGGALVAVTVTTAAVPHLRQISGLAVLFGIQGLAAGYYDAAGNMVLLKIWGAKNGPWMQALHCVFGLGALTGPLVAEPFLSTSRESSDITNVSISPRHGDNTTNTGYDVIYDVISNMTSAMNTSDAVTNLYGTETKIVWCYLIVAIACAVAAVLNLIPVLCLSTKPLSVTLCPNKPTKVDKKKKKKEEPTAQSRSEKIFRGTIGTLVFLFYLTYCILEINYGNYLTAYAVKYLNWTKATGAIVTSAYWGTFTAGRAAGIVFARFVSAPVILLSDICICIVALLPLLICPRAHTAVLWVSSITLGLGTSTVFATGISWTERYLKISSGMGAMFMIAGALGDLVGPLLIGIFFDTIGPQGFIYVMFSAACLLLVLFTVMQVTAFRHGRRRDAASTTPAIGQETCETEALQEVPSASS